MPAVTDRHVAIRDAVVGVMQAKAGAALAVENPDVELKTIDLPTVVVFCAGDAAPVPSLTTNARDGLAYTVVVAMMGHGVTGGPRGSNVPAQTEFRRRVRTAFHNQRLTGVAEVAWCEAADAGEVYDTDAPAFQKLTAAVAVTAYGRFPRTT